MGEYPISASALLALCIAGTFVWRAAGVAVARHIDPEGPIFQWVNCIAYGMLAALISRIILVPTGTLGETVMGDRLAAMACGFLVFFLCRRDPFPATIMGFAVFLALTWARHAGVI